jgi:alkanesulfonate monooxygenase SsuD/methylene tetrahydromethanopterin reductase-like flavin-dependent oxidoreductase (luciferase family)
MRLGLSLSSFAATAETTNVVELGSEAERLGLDSVWFAQTASSALLGSVTRRGGLSGG